MRKNPGTKDQIEWRIGGILQAIRGTKKVIKENESEMVIASHKSYLKSLQRDLKQEREWLAKAAN